MNIRHALGLACPPTWAASVFPVLLGAALAWALAGEFSWLVFLLLLAASILLQSSVNTINDYYDFLKGNDQKENSDDPGDAVLVYNDLDPHQVKRLGFGFMAAAVLLGIYPVYRGGLITLIIGLCGCLVIIAYSAGKKPISYMPLGEIVSGLVMGGLITLAAFSAFTASFRWEVLYLATPLFFGIALIMMTNNICDIERDAPIGRKTLPVLLGRSRARFVYLAAVIIWLFLLIICTAGHFRGGLLALCLLLLATLPVWLRLFRLLLLPKQRKQGMSTITQANICANSAYIAAILIHAWVRYLG